MLSSNRADLFITPSLGRRQRARTDLIFVPSVCPSDPTDKDTTRTTRLCHNKVTEVFRRTRNSKTLPLLRNSCRDVTCLQVMGKAAEPVYGRVIVCEDLKSWKSISFVYV